MTLSYSAKMFCKPNVGLGLWVSVLVIGAVSLSGAEDARDAFRVLNASSPDTRAIEAIAQKLGDKELSLAMREYVANPTAEKLQSVRSMAELRSIALQDAPGSNAQGLAGQITSSSSYSKLNQQESSNWISKGFEGFGDWLERLQTKDERRNTPRSRNGSMDWLAPLMWMLLGISVLVALFWIFSRISYKLGKRSAKAGLLESDEPERTADEWLTRSYELEAAGQFRNAVRALYLACLVRIDEYGVARFVRSETNWEHLRRIMKSSKAPKDLEFEAATRNFDEIWYGSAACDRSEVEQFRAIYTRILSLLQERKN